MRNAAAFAATLLLMLFATQPGGADQSSTNPNATDGTAMTTGTSTGTTGATTGGHKHKAAAATKYNGYVSGADQSAKSFNVSSCPTCQDVLTLKVNDKTRYLPKGNTWDDVKAGAKVSGTYQSDGTDNWALTVRFWKEKAAKPAAATPKAGK
jgi:hypothetical protein